MLQTKPRLLPPAKGGATKPPPRESGDPIRDLADLGPTVAATLRELLAGDDPAIRLRCCELWLKLAGMDADLPRELRGYPRLHPSELDTLLDSM